MKIEKTKSGKWTTRVCIDDSQGGRHWKRFTDKSRDKVRNMVNDYLNNHRVYAESMVLRDAARRFLGHAEMILSPNTVCGYKSADRTFRREFAAFYNKPVDRITGQDVQTVIDSMSAAGRTPKTIANRIGFISAVMTYNGEKMPPHKLPKARLYEPKVPSPEMMKLVVAEAAGTRYEIPLALAIFGLRRGEVCAVRAEDIGPDNVLHVQRALATDDDGFIHDKGPKEYASDRFILLPASLADAIREKGRATEMSPKAWSDAFPHLLARAGVPKDQRFRLHDCRHFFVSYCHDVLHLSDAQIIKLSGHKTDYVMKRVYRHAITDSTKEVSTRLESAFLS